MRRGRLAGILAGLVAWGAGLAACGRGHDEAGQLVVRVTDRGTPIGARLVLFDEAGQPVHAGTLDLYGQRQGAAACRLGPQVLATWGGLVVGERAGDTAIPVGRGPCQIPPGRYRVWAWHGLDFERAETTVDLARGGRVVLDVPLVRAWSTPAIAADLHVHAARSNDSTMPDEQRVLALVASGIQMAALSNHNQHGDLDAAIRALGLDRAIASIASSELTSEALHVGVYPVPVTGAADGGAAPADTLVHAGARELFALAHAMSTRPIVQVNHPRFRYGALFDLTKWDGRAWPPPFPTDFDALEVIAGYSAADVPGDRRIDDSVRDLYTLVDHGVLVAALGNSDTHDFNWVLDGTARSYVFVEPTAPPLDEAAFIRAIRARRTLATTCPLLDVRATGKGPGELVDPHGATTTVTIDLHQAKFCHVTRIRITIGTPTGPALVETIAIPPDATSHHWEGPLATGTADTWIGVTADGDAPLPLEQTGTYQRDKWQRPGVSPYAVISPILVDADGDGAWKR